MTDINGRLGVNVNSLLSAPSTAAAVLAELAAAGVYIARLDFSWNVTEPTNGTYQWATLDTIMQAARTAGVQICGVLSYSALWANDGVSIFDPPTNPTDFAGWGTAVATRYGRTSTFWVGASTFYPLIALEIWNEPNGNWFWKPGNSPSAYAALVAATAPAIRAADATIKIVACGDWWSVNADGSSGTWLTPLLSQPQNVASLVDVFTVHPYPDPKSLSPDATTGGTFTNRYFGSQITTPQAILAAAGLTNPIWITEAGWSTGGDAAALSQAQQSSYLLEAVRLALDVYGVQMMSVYSFDLAAGAAAEFNGVLATAADVAAWKGVNATVALDATQPYLGNAGSMKVVAAGGASAHAEKVGLDTVQAGFQYDFSAYVYGPPAGQFFQLEIQWWTLAPAFVSNVLSGWTFCNPGWTQLPLTVTVPTGAPTVTSALLKVETANTTPAAGMAFWVSNVALMSSNGIGSLEGNYPIRNQDGTARPAWTALKAELSAAKPVRHTRVRHR